MDFFYSVITCKKVFLPFSSAVVMYRKSCLRASLWPLCPGSMPLNMSMMYFLCSQAKAVQERCFAVVTLSDMILLKDRYCCIIEEIETKFNLKVGGLSIKDNFM